MIGIDVGGANLKVATGEGVFIHYCPLWEESPLRDLLRQYRGRGEDAAVVVSGELADCFSSKEEGIRFIVDAVQEVFPKARFYGMDAVFHETAVPALAAANWLVSAEYLMDRYPGSLLVDFGSTTTDIIPLTGMEHLKGLTDLARLRNGFLVYTGLLRTTVPALIREVAISGVLTPVCPEYFACSADVHLVLGHITSPAYTIDPPDRKATDRVAALRRLSRVVCADTAEIGEEGAVAIARAFWDAQRSIICGAVERVAAACGTRGVLCAGIGAGLVAGLTRGTDLSHEIGPAADALPAFAVREVAKRRPGS
ncbi:MAG TPA: H4MPT-linked C1 transfer pathway protein [Methanoregulaceae archaeon]|nr:H4MPT-linked C1 transfer pathway protein [Methanoregulaceae archaeon]